MATGTKVIVSCPTINWGQKINGIITGEKPLSPEFIKQNGKTYYVKIDGRKKTETLHESYLTINE